MHAKVAYTVTNFKASEFHRENSDFSSEAELTKHGKQRMRLLAALESLIQRLRHLAQELLLSYCAADPTAYAHLWSQLDEAALFGPADEKTECYLSPHEWRERLLATVAAILNCQHAIRQTAVAAPVQHWLDRLDKLFGDELRLELDEKGQLRHLALLTKRGTYRLCSATDPEATIRNHGSDKNDLPPI